MCRPPRAAIRSKVAASSTISCWMESLPATLNSASPASARAVARTARAHPRRVSVSSAFQLRVCSAARAATSTNAVRTVVASCSPGMPWLSAAAAHTGGIAAPSAWAIAAVSPGSGRQVARHRCCWSGRSLGCCSRGRILPEPTNERASARSAANQRMEGLASAATSPRSTNASGERCWPMTCRAPVGTISCPTVVCDHGSVPLNERARVAWMLPPTRLCAGCHASNPSRAQVNCSPPTWSSTIAAMRSEPTQGVSEGDRHRRAPDQPTQPVRARSIRFSAVRPGPSSSTPCRRRW